MKEKNHWGSTVFSLLPSAVEPTVREFIKLGIGKLENQMKKRTWLYFLVDVLIVTMAFLFFIWLKPASKRVYLPEYSEPFLFFLVVWVGVSFSIDKYRLYKKESINDILFPILAGDFIVLATVVTLIYGFQNFGYSRMIVFGTIFLSLAAEVVLAYLFYYNRQMRRDADHIASFRASQAIALQNRERLIESDAVLQERISAPAPPLNKELIIRESGEEVFRFISDHIDAEHNRTLLVSTTTLFNIENQPDDFYNAVINLKKTNDILRINKFFESVNGKLPYGGFFIGCATLDSLVKQRILKKYPAVINYIFYTFYFMFKRVMPKLPVLKRIYFFFTRGRKRALSRAETLGRLCSCGFNIRDEQVINQRLYFLAEKIQEPAYDYHPTYGALIRLKRVGKGGKTIYVYKMRTMHPYSEYLQEYVYQRNNLADGGKFHNDFRVSTLGRFMRRFWIDELPMLINLVRRDMKLVGVRPLSQQYYELYDEELKDLRIRTRPGLIPPYYADMPSTLEEIQASEKKYLESYLRNPFLTDWRYFWKATYNIVVKKARSG